LLSFGDINLQKQFWLYAVLAAALTACGGSGGSSNGEGSKFAPKSNNSTGAIVASGAPLPNVPFKVIRLSDNSEISSGRVGVDAYLQTSASASDAPFLIQVTDTGVNPNLTYQNIVLPSDFDSDGKANLNITPISTIVSKIVLNQAKRSLKESIFNWDSQRADAANAVKAAIQPLLDAQGLSSTTGLSLITQVFTPVSDPLDKVLDMVKIECLSDTNCTIKPASAKASLTTGPLTINTSNLTLATESAGDVKTKLSSAKNEMLATAPVVVVFSAGGAWGTANDAWAGYTGKFTIYNFTDQAVEGGAKLYFESTTLKQNGFWDVTATVADSKYALTLPTWGNIGPKSTTSEKPPSYTFGFNGSGIPSSVTDLSACNLNGKKCLILIDDGSLPVDTNRNEVKVRSWVNFLGSLSDDVSNERVRNETKVTPPPSRLTSTDNVQSTQQEVTVPSPQNRFAQIALVGTSSWVGGFNGELQLTNTSNVDWTSWKVSFKKPDSITAFGGWGNYKLDTSESTVTFTNESWNGALGKGKLIKLGFGGTGKLDTNELPTNCTISFNNSAAVKCDSAATTTNNTNLLTGANTTVQPTPPNPVQPPPTPKENNESPNGNSASQNQPNTPVIFGKEPSTVAEAVKITNPNTRVYVGYYPSWSDNWFSYKDWAGKDLTKDQILVASKLARVPATYTHVVVAFAQPDFKWSTKDNYNKNSWTGTGLNFNAGPQDIKASIEVLHKRGIKVLAAVGGATYNNWKDLALENGVSNGLITNALKQMMLDVGFDGLDVDYEVDGITTSDYKGAVNAMRKAVDLANAEDNGSRWLTLAGWSTGADPAGSYWGGKAGGERLAFEDPAMAKKIDMVSIMSYDARYENYDGPKAWDFYRDLFPSTTIVNIGLETAPEGWAGGMLVVNDSDAQCVGSRIEKDQVGNKVDLPYSVNRYASWVMQSNHKNRNPRDGAMLWQILKTATASCGTSTVASPGTIAKKISELYDLPNDLRDAWR
jgi:hypothetical protein